MNFLLKGKLMNKFLVMSLLVGLSGCSVVGPGERGVSVFMGEASTNVKAPGWYLWVPFVRNVEQISVQVQKSETETTAASHDMQTIKTQVVTNWHVDPQTVPAMFIRVGDEDDIVERIINPSVAEVFKAATAKLTAEEILTQRIELTRSIGEMLRTRLSSYGVLVDDVALVDLSFSEKFNHAIEEKQVAEQSAKQAEYEAQKAKIDATARVNKAEGEAKSQLIKAKAEAEANRLKLQTLTPQLIQYEAVQKWNGNVPQVMGSSGGMMFNLPIKGDK
jgi:prohibitin 1